MHGNSHPTTKPNQKSNTNLQTAAGATQQTPTLQRFNPLPTWTTVPPVANQAPVTSTTKPPPRTTTHTKPNHRHAPKQRPQNPLALTPEEERATIRTAFYEDDTVPKEKILKTALGKRPKLVRLTSFAKHHPAAALLDAYSNGCPTNCGPNWSQEHIEAALRRGPHPSALSNDAKEALYQETQDKVNSGYARVVKYGDIKADLPKKLKISPVAMIPHKSRKFRTILDLSFRLRHNGRLLESVNSATVKQAPAESMIQLGNCIKRLVATLADNYDPDKPFYFAKLDIKDGFWRMAVADEDAWNFCYVLPPDQPGTTKLDDIKIVVPNSLQMGWCESPPFFCAASETARDVIEALLTEVKLPGHRLENDMLQHATTEAVDRLHAAAAYVNLLEVFVDDFIAITNNGSTEHLTHLSRAMLHGIHSVFPPPETSGHHGQDPISQKKLDEGEGTWNTTKEILGWIVNGTMFTVQLPPSKCQKIIKLCRKVANMKACKLQVFQELAGKLQHASFGVPGGKGLFSPIHRAMQGSKPYVRITKQLRSAILDWRPLIRDLANHPTPVRLLVSDFPQYVLYTDSCKIGAGGVVTPGLDGIPYVVWQFEWPEDIQNRLVTTENPKGDLTINDLELAGMVLGWLVLEYIWTKLSFKHIGLFCDNTSAVAWAFKGSTSTSIAAGRLLRFLAIRQRLRQTSSLMPRSIAGRDNKMADIPSRAFKHGEFFHAQESLTDYFNLHFPLPQDQSWTEFTVTKKLASRVISCLRGEPLLMEQLRKLPKLGKNTGSIGQNTAKNARWNHTSSASARPNKQQSSSPLPQESGPGLTASEIRSEFNPSRMLSRPSPRPMNWLDNKVPSTKRRENTFFPSNDC